MDSILATARRHDLKVVEDAAQGILANYDNSAGPDGSCSQAAPARRSFPHRRRRTGNCRCIGIPDRELPRAGVDQAVARTREAVEIKNVGRRAIGRTVGNAAHRMGQFMQRDPDQKVRVDVGRKRRAAVAGRRPPGMGSCEMAKQRADRRRRRISRSHCAAWQISTSCPSPDPQDGSPRRNPSVVPPGRLGHGPTQRLQPTRYGSMVR